MKLVDLELSRFIPGPADEVFEVWFDPKSPGGPWHGAKKAIMNRGVDGLFYFGIDRAQARTRPPDIRDADSLVAHFGRFTAWNPPHAAEHTWVTEHTHGLETTVSVAFESRDGGTQLTIEHRGLPDDDTGRQHERGWTFLLGRVAEHFEKRAEEP